MTNGRIIIDGRDITAYYGAYITDQGLNALLSWPSSKKVDTVSWAESDYLDADLSDLKLAALEAVVTFGMSGYPTDVTAFVSWLSESIYRTWNVLSLRRTFRVRYVGVSSLSASDTLQSFAVSVAIDTPLDGYDYVAPVSQIGSVNEYAIDGVQLSDYGVRILLGTLDSTARPGRVKGLLKRDISTVDGVLYDEGGTNRKETYDITLRCAMIDTTEEGLWRNYDALLYDLIRKDRTAAIDTDMCKRAIYSRRLDRTFECYYKSQTVRSFLPDGGRIWLLFDMTLGMVGDMAAPAYLATEAGAWVNTENSYKILI